MYYSHVVEKAEIAVVRRFASILIPLLFAPLPVHAATIVGPTSAYLEVNSRAWKVATPSVP
jgi:hypothetical protein